MTLFSLGFLDCRGRTAARVRALRTWSSCFGCSLAAIAGSAVAQPPAPIGSEVGVNTTTTGLQDFHSVAVLDDGTFIVVWETDATGDDDIMLRRFAADGTALSAEVPVNATTTGEQQDPDVAALRAGGFVVVWDSGTGGNREIVGRLFENDTTPVAGEFSVSDEADHDHNDAAVAGLLGSDFVVVWEREGADTTNEDLVAREFLAARGPSGFIDVNVTVAEDQEDVAIAAAADGNYVVAWESGDDSDDDIFARRFQPGVGALGGEIAVSTEGGGLQENCDVAMHPDGRFAVVYENDATDPWSVRARFYDATATPVSAPFTVNTANRPVLAPSIAMDSIGRGIVVWDRLQLDGTSDIIANAVNSDGSLEGAEFVVNEASGEVEIVPKIALGPGGGLWAWIACPDLDMCDFGDVNDLDLDLEARAFVLPIFADGFESENTDAWSN